MEMSFSDLKPDRPDELEQIEATGGLVIFWEGARVRTGHGSEQRHHHLALTSLVKYNAMATTRREGKKIGGLTGGPHGHLSFCSTCTAMSSLKNGSNWSGLRSICV